MIGDDINDVRKRIEKMERRIDQLDHSFAIFKDIILRMQKENITFKQDRDFLVEKYKKLVRQLQPEKTKLETDVKKILTSSVKNKIVENAEFFREFSREGFDLSEGKPQNVPKEDETPIDELFVMVMKEGSVNLGKAARKLKVHELQVEEWAKILEDHGLIEIYRPENGKPELRKSGFSSSEQVIK